MTQGEVVSEWLDVDEVEEAFAKMRRAAGVRISIFSERGVIIGLKSMENDIGQQYVNN